MKIHVVSDVHLEFGDYPYDPPADVDVIVLAGDIGINTQGIDWAKEKFKDYPVLYVLGNHEYYKRKLPLKGGADILKEYAKGSNVTVLNNDTHVIDGVRFLGTTLWTDLNLHNSQGLLLITAYKEMNDYRQIVHENKNKIKAFHTIDEFLVAKSFLESEFAKSFDGKTVVVTHHLPTEQGCFPQYSPPAHRTNPFFASNLESMILDNQPDVWIFGHTHHAKDFNMGKTRLVCNPRGYKHHEKSEVNDKFVVEI